jgi:uncharacterized protein with HEPN domain
VGDAPERLKDILKAAEHILAKTGPGRQAFGADEMLQVWVLHHLQIIGEAARSLSQEFRQHRPDRVWAEAVGMRNILVHRYFEIDADEVWKVVETDLTSLRDRVAQILEGELP